MRQPGTNAAADNTDAFFSLTRNRLKFQIFLLKSLPAAWFAGLKIVSADQETCTVSIPFKWFTKNPFHSVYFACLSMAAEMSTGILAMAHVYKRNPGVSMLVINVEGKFYKKATGKINFICRDGVLIKQTIENAIHSGEAQTIRVLSSGYNTLNETVSEFWITWSFKAKTAK